MHRIDRVGRDESGLGRWVWMTIKGKKERVTRIVSAYRPVYSTLTGSVYEQHRRHLHKSGDPRNPIQALDVHLALVVRKWREDGEDVILGWTITRMYALEDYRSNLLS